MDPLKPHMQRIVDAEVERLRRKADTEHKSSKEGVALNDQKRLLNLDLGRILVGDVEVYDDRPRS